MSLIGIRDMSIIDEPPEERYPVQTYVSEFNKSLIREAILKEISRGGQVYYVYNRVESIEKVAFELEQLVPEASFRVAHGQMTERQLENVMLDFINNVFDVLVCTTIIETGMDIQNVNTIIIHDADKFGLSQLYQLKGRVGRTNRLSYAYLMYQKDKVLSEVAQKRLKAIKDFTEFGAGFKIAMRDLEIRGSGNLLGLSQ
ncbi:helicase-related protein, partial [Vibrio parahaemolyticus]|nr:helicase-related protein [Vibrio parahaemolyticus]